MEVIRLAAFGVGARVLGCGEGRRAGVLGRILGVLGGDFFLPRGTLRNSSRLQVTLNFAETFGYHR